VSTVSRRTRVGCRGCCAKPAGHLKKALSAQEIERADVAKRRRRRLCWLLPWLSRRLAQLVFIDETASALTRLRGRARQGRRLRAKAPHANGTAMWGRDEQETQAKLDAWNAPIHRVRARIERSSAPGSVLMDCFECDGEASLAPLPKSISPQPPTISNAA